MILEEYQNVFKNEDIHWWYKSLHDIVLNVLFGIIRNSSSVILLDAGCGTGGMLKAVQEKFPSWNLAGIDISHNALRYSSYRNSQNLFQASVEYLPFDDNSIDAVISLDVLYHLQVADDEKALAEIYRVISKGGYLLLHLPAFELLRGNHDKVVHTKRRFRKNQLCNKVEKAGFKVIICTYRHMIMFPILFAKRMIDKCRANKVFKSDIDTLPAWLNTILIYMSYCENRLIKYFSLPVGSSLLCLCRKP